nr:ketol-acid reductoisomerase, chloroplastic-like [Tanacetum cinerariifolium]
MVLWNLYLEDGMSEDLAHKNIIECITGNILRTISTQVMKATIDATEEAEEFLFLSEKKIPPPANQTTASARTRSVTHSSVHTYHGHDCSPSTPYIPKQPPVIKKSKPPTAYNPNLLGTYYPKHPGTYPKPPGTYIPKPPPLTYKSQTMCQL